MKKHHMKEAAKKRYAKTKDEHGKLISEMISSGSLMVEILKQTGLLQTYFVRFLCSEYPDLVFVLKENWKKKKAENARINGRKSALCLKGVALKPVSAEIEQLFISLKQSKANLAEIKRQLYPLGFKHKKIMQLCEKHGHPVNGKSMKGEKNPMFGRTPGQNAGIGVSGHIVSSGEKIFFRSSLEMRIYMFMLFKGLVFSLSKHRIPYKNNGVQRTYCPDFVVGNTVVEIKPFAMIKLPINVLKFKAARKYCAERGLVFEVKTEKDYNLDYLDKKTIEMALETGFIVMSEDNKEKLWRSL